MDIYMTTEELGNKGSELIHQILTYVKTGNAIAPEAQFTKLEQFFIYIFGGETREDLIKNIDNTLIKMNQNPTSLPDQVNEQWLEENPVWDIVHGLVKSHLPRRELKF